MRLLLSVLFAASCVSASIDTATLDFLMLSSQYAAAVYCPYNTAPTLPAPPLRCYPSNNCPLVEKSDTTIVGGQLNAAPFDATYYVALDHTRRSIIVTFRGASRVGVVTKNASALVPCPEVCSACRCWEGFYSAYVSVRSTLTSLLSDAKAQQPSYDFTVIGHSLGAAQATFLAAELKTNVSAGNEEARRITTVTFGSPRVGDENLASHLTGPSSFRVTHTDDPAPRMGDGEYRHVSPEYWISSNSNTATYDVLPHNIDVFEGTNNRSGNAGTGGRNLAAHLQYFQPNMTACWSQ